ncbi:MAG: ArsA family ATPase [Proteobacteria bacterium]|nr:ArsA family ATPase [Pseudomonadota bacterium]
MKELLDKRVVFVVGKGGVGKSVISATLAMRVAKAGMRSIVAEMNGAETMAALFDHEPVGYETHELAPRVHAISVTPNRATEEYLLRMLRFRLLYELVFRNRYIEPFMNGVLGLSDLISAGKVMDLEWERVNGSHGPSGKGPHQWDLVIVDSPATGHGLSLLRSPKAIMDLTRIGPMHTNAKQIQELLADRSRTSVLLVTLAEEMPVSETLELAADLRKHVDIDIAGVVVNGVPPKLFASEEAAAQFDEVRAVGLAAGGQAAAAVRDAERLLRDRARAEEHIKRLRGELDLPFAEVPMLARRDLDAEALTSLGTHLEWLA